VARALVFASGILVVLVLAVGDDGAGVLLEMVPSATPPHARNAPSSRPKGDGDKRKALPYAQLLSQVHPGDTTHGYVSRFRFRPERGRQIRFC
jgi:hypothetical protein